MSLKRILSFDLNRIDLTRVLLFDVNRILRFDLDRILTWSIPPMLLRGLAGWFLAAITLDVIGMKGRLAVFLVAASAGTFMMLPDLVRRMRRAAEHRLN